MVAHIGKTFDMQKEMMLLTCVDDRDAMEKKRDREISGESWCVRM